MTAQTEAAETYNGWKNYPTWNVALWLDNDEGLYNATRETVSLALTYADNHPNVPGLWMRSRRSCGTSLRPTWAHRSRPIFSATR
jgi:hypothetical protein